MAKKVYVSPVLLGLTPGEDPNIGFGASQGTSGYDSPYSFSGIQQEDLNMIALNCDDLDLQDMDTSPADFVITAEEFEAWLEARGGW